MTDLGLILGAYGLSWLSLGITKRTKRVTRSIGLLLLFMGLLSSYAEIRSPFFGTRFWEMSVLFALLFGIGYSYLFVGLCSHLGILGFGRAIRASVLPLAHVGLIATMIGLFKAEDSQGSVLVLFASIELVSAIHVALFASVTSNWHKRGYLPTVNGPPNEDPRDLDWALLGLGLTTAILIIGLIWVRRDVELFALNLVLVGILAVPVVIVRRMTQAKT